MASPLPRAPWLPWTAFGFAFVGLLDSVYLTWQHYTGGVIPCNVTHGCEIVTTSIYSSIVGIPVALLGALYYAAILFGIFVAIDSHDQKLLRLVFRATILGFLFSVWLVIAQIFLIEAICQWCLVSALTSTLLFLLSYLIAPRYFPTSPGPSQPPLTPP